jgi:parallel beta-helix repeat protein
LSVAGLATGAVLMVLASPAGSDIGGCDRVASTTGSDSNPGTVQRPFRTPQRLIESLSGGQTGCFRTGTYSQDSIAFRRTSGVTITSYPGERATVQGRIFILTNRVTLANLNLDGRNSKGLPSPTINGDDVVIRDNDITNGHTAGSCVHPTPYNGLFPERVVIVHNRIHDCGRLPAMNLDHGIYFNATGGLIESNVIYDNADQGIVLYPAGKGTVVKSNTVDGNGEGIQFAGGGWDHSDVNLVTQNIVSNSRLRWNIEAYWEGDPGLVNLAAGNCLWATNPDPYYNARGGVSTDPGFTAAANKVGDPGFRDRAAKDFRLRLGSPCRGDGAEP